MKTYFDHAEMEKDAQRIYKRVERLTGWRDEKIRFWLDQQNPLLGMVTPIWLIQHGRVQVLDRFIDRAQGDQAVYQAQYGSKQRPKE